MVPFTLLVSFSLVSLLCKAEAEGTPLFKQTGQDLLLEVREAVTLEGHDQILWSFNGKDFARYENGGKPIIYKSHLERAELSPGNLSLLLRNLTKGDSGDYKARVTGDNLKEIAKYEVTVLDPVSPVNLTVTNCSSDSSNLTVSCSTQDSLISKTFTCDDQNCSEERGEREESTSPAASLKVYLKKDTIICVHSNNISRTEDIKKIEDFCKKDPEPKTNNSDGKVLWIVLSILFAILLLIILGVVLGVVYHRKKGKYKTESMENTEYEVPQASNTNLPLEQRTMNETLQTDNPPTIYHLLGHPLEPEASTEAQVTQLPESVYATVQKVQKVQKS